MSARAQSKEPKVKKPAGTPTGELPVVTKMYDLLLWLIPRIDKLPRSRRFTLGERMEEAAFDALLDLVEAAYSSEKLDTLRAANLHLEKVRFLLRISCENLLRCYRLARRGKRHHYNVAFFDLELEKNLHRIRRQLLDRTYQPGPYKTMVVSDTKRRMISASPFCDRIVHHALTSVLEPMPISTTIPWIST